MSVLEPSRLVQLRIDTHENGVAEALVELRRGRRPLKAAVQAVLDAQVVSTTASLARRCSNDLVVAGADLIDCLDEYLDEKMQAPSVSPAAVAAASGQILACVKAAVSAFADLSRSMVADRRQMLLGARYLRFAVDSEIVPACLERGQPDLLRRLPKLLQRSVARVGLRAQHLFDIDDFRAELLRILSQKLHGAVLIVVAKGLS